MHFATCCHGLLLLSSAPQDLLLLVDKSTDNFESPKETATAAFYLEQIKNSLSNLSIDNPKLSKADLRYLRMELGYAVMTMRKTLLNSDQLPLFVSKVPEVQDCPECYIQSWRIWKERSTKLQIGKEIAEVLGDFPSDRYFNCQVIGRGAYGKVFRYSDKKLDRDVAIKQIEKQQSQATGHDLGKLEATVTAKIRNSHVASIHDVFESDRFVYIVQDLFEGKTLREHIEDFRGVSTDKNGGLGFDLRFGRNSSRYKDFLNILTHILHVARAVRSAHEKGIYHRDLHYENVLVDVKQLETLVVDWGKASSQFTSKPFASWPVSLRPEFELVNNKECVDLYSLGAMLCFLLHGVVHPNEKSYSASAPLPLHWIALEAMGRLRGDQKGEFQFTASPDNSDKPLNLGRGRIDWFIEELESFIAGQSTSIRPDTFTGWARGVQLKLLPYLSGRQT